jgi:hypothetical protein
MNLPRFMVNFLLSTAFATSFIALFFFTYVKNIEREIVLDNVNYVIDDLTTTFLTILPEPIKALLEFKLDNIELKDLSEADNKVKEDNNKLLMKSAKTFGLILVINVSLAVYISHIYKINFTEILISNLLLLTAIALTEFFFLKLVIRKYISANPNKVKEIIFDNLVN